MFLIERNIVLVCIIGWLKAKSVLVADWRQSFCEIKPKEKRKESTGALIAWWDISLEKNVRVFEYVHQHVDGGFGDTRHKSAWSGFQFHRLASPLKAFCLSGHHPKPVMWGLYTTWIYKLQSSCLFPSKRPIQTYSTSYGNACGYDFFFISFELIFRSKLVCFALLSSVWTIQNLSFD